MTTCDAVDPFNTIPDEPALRPCLDDFDWVLLKPDHLPGYVGHLVSDTLKLKRSTGLLTTADNPHRVTIRAAPDRNSSMLIASGINNFEVSFIRFDGNRENRLVRDKPCDAGHNFRNVELTGTGFRVRYVESFGAVCGSALTVGGSSNFEICGSLFFDNGRQPEESSNIFVRLRSARIRHRRRLPSLAPVPRQIGIESGGVQQHFHRSRGEARD